MRRQKKNMPHKKREIYVDGELLKFHSNIEQIKKIGEKKNKKESFFSTKNRHIHFTILNLFLILIAVGVYYFFMGRTNSYRKDGVLIYFSKKRVDINNNLEFRIQIKNFTNQEKKIDEYKEIEFVIYNINGKSIYEKKTILPKTVFLGKEYHTEYIIIDKPSEGNYSAVINFGKEDDEKMEIKFRVKL